MDFAIFFPSFPPLWYFLWVNGVDDRGGDSGGIGGFLRCDTTYAYCICEGFVLSVTFPRSSRVASPLFYTMHPSSSPIHNHTHARHSTTTLNFHFNSTPNRPDSFFPKEPGPRFKYPCIRTLCIFSPSGRPWGAAHLQYFPTKTPDTMVCTDTDKDAVWTHVLCKKKRRAREENGLTISRRLNLPMI